MAGSLPRSALFSWGGSREPRRAPSPSCSCSQQDPERPTRASAAGQGSRPTRLKLVPPLILACLIAIAAAPRSTDPLVLSAQHKLDVIQSGKAKPGSVFVFTLAELNAWGRNEVKALFPEGVRNTRLELGKGTATAYMMVDFLKIRHGKKLETGWLLSKMLEGERPLRVSGRIESAHGRATVHLTLVSISGVPISGATLDFLVETFFLPLYPDAKINQPFDLHDNVDHIEVLPSEARAVIKR